MTTIREPTVPYATGEHPADNSRRAWPWLLLVAISCIMVTGMNLMTAAHLKGAIREAAAIEAKLQALSEQEQRLRAALDLMNKGVQAQIDEVSAELAGGFAEMREKLRVNQRHLAAIEAELAADPSRPMPPLITLPPESMVDEEWPEDQPVASGAPPTVTADAVPEPSKSYQRVESPDGRVLYRRIR
jgi:hypothetical protein